MPGWGVFGHVHRHAPGGGHCRYHSFSHAQRYARGDTCAAEVERLRPCGVLLRVHVRRSSCTLDGTLVHASARLCTHCAVRLMHPGRNACAGVVCSASREARPSQIVRCPGDKTSPSRDQMGRTARAGIGISHEWPASQQETTCQADSLGISEHVRRVTA